MNRQFQTLTALGFSAVAILFAASDAEAHARLVSAAPADKAVVASPKLIEAHFSENLEPKFSSFDVTAANGAKVAMAQMSVDPKDKKILTGAPQAPLAPGAYKVSWHVVASDGHKVEGTYGFTVK
jgi:methionine-rich copper-binding protein CopC